jgi:apolipoprotein D and lipocalin family protein
MMKKLFLSSLLVFLSCAQAKPLKKVDYVDIPRFMGKWYVIANIPTFIEVGAHNAVETYTWNEKKNRIDVGFSFRKNDFSGEEKSYPQKAWVHDSSGNEWRIQFVWPLKFAYLVIDLDQDYQTTVIGVPDRKYVWIMARTPSISQEVYGQILNRLTEQGYDVSRIKMVPQKW